jgi:hypothetical protein
MAISVDTIYQRVLTLANKEQRGYITPQEFNLLANQAQMTIFESYFYSKNAKNLQEPDRTNEVDETDIGELLARKLAPFSTIAAVTSGNTFPPQVTINSVARDVFQVGMIMANDLPCQKVSRFELQRLINSTRHMATTSGQAPIYADSRTDGDDIEVYAGSATPVTSNIEAEYFGVPRPANWAYVVVNGKALFNSTLAVDFELHKSETDTLVNRILELFAIVINKPGLVSIMGGKDAAEIATQKL